MFKFIFYYILLTSSLTSINQTFAEGIYYNVPITEVSFPFGVCFDFDTEYRVLYYQEPWILKAMESWNKKYEEYKTKYLGIADIVGLPNGPLFVESCDQNNYNIIYIEVRDNIPHKNLGLFRPGLAPTDRRFTDLQYQGQRWDGTNTVKVSTILISSEFQSEHIFFINVMVHELGHAIDLPHTTQDFRRPRKKMTVYEILDKFGVMYANRGYINIRSMLQLPQDVDIENFLKPFLISR